MKLAMNAVHQGDCIEGMSKLPAGSVDLAFADPPFNIGYDYDVYDDRKATNDYLDWSRQWIAAVHRALKPDGTFWLAIGDEYAAELKLIAQREVGFHCRSWVIWYYTFGVNCTKKFSRSHAHLFHFIKDPKQFTFNAGDPTLRVPSARQLVYADTRANPNGRLPDDTWILRPQDVPGGFAEGHDTWYVPRVAGTFKERAGFHGCQMPEQLLGRIIRASSNADDVVMDPFAGSGTTLAVAKKLGRRWLGFELSTEYATKVRERIASIRQGQPLDGAKNPLSSAPTTNAGKQLGVNGKAVRLQSPAMSSRDVSGLSKQSSNHSSAGSQQDIERGVVEAYAATHDGFSVDRLLADPELDYAFTEKCFNLGLAGGPVDWSRLLLRLRKAKKLVVHAGRRAKPMSWQEMEPYHLAAEIAWAKIAKQHQASLDDILCDPQLKSEFDRIASTLAPGFRPLEYRWAAFSIRKRAHSLAEKIGDIDRKSLRSCGLTDLDTSTVRGKPGVYLLQGRGEDRLAAGYCYDLGSGLDRQLEFWRNPAWKQFHPQTISFFDVQKAALSSYPELYRFRLVLQKKPRLHVYDLYANPRRERVS